MSTTLKFKTQMLLRLTPTLNSAATADSEAQVLLLQTPNAAAHSADAAAANNAKC